LADEQEFITTNAFGNVEGGMKMQFVEILSKRLDKLVRPEIRLLRHPWPAFKVCGYVGLTFAILLTQGLVLYQGLSPLVLVAMILAAIATFFGLAMLTKIITGEEQLIYYHHEIAVMLAVSILLLLLHQPVFAYLDVAILGIGAFLVCGRVGCLMVGCCHGRPHSWGVCYRAEHAAVGFTPYYVGVRLFPIQAVESLWALCVVLVGCIFILGGNPAGTVLTWYVVAYDSGRFCFEFVRGDSERSYLWGFSEAQWISLGLMLLVSGGELAHVLPLYAWHIGVVGCMVLAMVIVTLSRRWRNDAQYQLLHPHHVKEVAEVIEALSTQVSEHDADPTHIYIGSTSLGIQISASTIQGPTDLIHLYAFSSTRSVMTEEAAKTLATLISQLKHHTGSDSHAL
jgi:prolipoprotein diacylglyceryltransferase